ncbi:tetratricopeptide repeat protein [Chryseobacterium sp.]|uniref:tetratricopeptide repeat protein n=1 Tax=Chryseobacterium sp. TaxID=1871047 RepID=UPI00388E7909
MKRKIILITGIIGIIIAIIFFIAIIKNIFFTDGQTKLYEDGWTAYENKQYDLTIFYLNKVEKNKYPDIVAPLGFSYFEKKDFQNTISNLKEAYDKKIGEKEGYYDKIANTLGISYLEKGDYDKSELYLKKAQELGNENALRNLQILDSLQQSQQKRP